MISCLSSFLPTLCIRSSYLWEESKWAYKIRERKTTPYSGFCKKGEGEATHVWVCRFGNRVQQGKGKTFGLNMYLTLRSLVSRLVLFLFFFGESYLFATPIENGGFKSYITTIFGSGLETMYILNTRETTLETKLLKVRHMWRPKFFYLGLPKSVLRPSVLEWMCVASTWTAAAACGLSSK